MHSTLFRTALLAAALLAGRAVTDLTAQERAALALWLLQQKPMTTRQVAERVDLSMDGARCMLKRISRVVPVVYEGRRWWVEYNQTE